MKVILDRINFFTLFKTIGHDNDCEINFDFCKFVKNAKLLKSLDDCGLLKIKA